MKDAGEDRGATASTGKRNRFGCTDEEVTEFVQQILDDLKETERSKNPQLKGIRKMDMERMRYTDTRIRYAPYKSFGKSFRAEMRTALRISRFMLIFVILFLLGATNVTTPALWPVGMTALAGWLGYRHLRGSWQSARWCPIDHGANDVRIGDAQRDETIGVLGVHYAAGRLDVMEYETRAAQAISATYGRDLKACLKDLPLLTREEKKRI